MIQLRKLYRTSTQIALASAGLDDIGTKLYKPAIDSVHEGVPRCWINPLSKIVLVCPSLN